MGIGLITPEGLAKAERVKTFIESLTFTSGKWAEQKFILLDWQWEEVILPFFGTLKENGFRQYRFLYLEIPKKNGKTELGAALALYFLCADGERGPKVYSAAVDREQATLVYTPAAIMVGNNDMLSRRILVRNAAKRLIYPKNKGVYQVLSSDVESKHGFNASAVIVDEIHGFPNDRLWRVLTAGSDYAREQQAVIVLTTAGIWDKTSIWWKIREKARQIKAGIVKQPNFLPVLYIADPEKDKPEDEELWKRVNPSIDYEDGNGGIFTLDRIRDDYSIATQDPVDFQDFLRFRLNIPVKQVSRWMPMDSWDKCGKEAIDFEALKGLACFGGLDLSTKIDLTAFLLVFYPQDGLDKFIVVPKFYVPEETILKRSKQDAVHYEIWAEQGFLTATPGNTIDEEFILKDILEAAEDYSLQEIGYDPWGATAIANKLFNTHGIEMVEVRQGAKSMSEPAKDILVKIKTGQVMHGGHEVLRWCADNLVMVADANENIRPDKEKATERIDGIVAMINAWNRITNTIDLGPSIYDSQGIEIV